MYLLFYLAILPLLIGVALGHLYVRYDRKCKLDKEINELFKSYKGE
jgi:uncharacterized membrane-anchored protein YhcB (DUF1043 family)